MGVSSRAFDNSPSPTILGRLWLRRGRIRVEGFVSQKHMKKEDGTVIKAEEKLDFKVIEFNKSAKRIVLSHTWTFEDKQKRPEKKKKEEADTKRAPRKIKSSLEKTTLGDISELAALKTEMEENQKKTDVKKDSPKEK